MSAISQLKEIGGKQIKKSLGISDNDTNELVKQSLPWNEQSDAFFSPIDIQPKRATQLYPYKLLVIDIKNNSIVGGKNLNKDSFLSYRSDTGGIVFEQNPTSTWEITLPITPQQLSITDQFAINTTATMRGIVEEHNGVKFKIISAQGTTGVWPRAQRGATDSGAGKGLSLFGGTIGAFNSAIRAANNLVGKTNASNFISDAEQRTDTGYFQAILIQQFLEQYAMAKKDPKNKHWRLVFHYPKNNESYIVTPIQYVTTKSQKSPLETFYQIQLKAWKRIDLKSALLEKTSKVQGLTPDFFQKITTKLDNARSLMSAGLNVVKAVRADFRKPFEALRKVTLLVKDFAGIAVTAADLPNAIGRDISSALNQAAADLDLASSLGNKSSSGQTKAKAAQNAIRGDLSKSENLSDDDVNNGGLGRGARNANQTSPKNKIKDNPEDFFDLYNAINVGDLNLTPQQQQAIDDETELNSLLSIQEIKEFTREIAELSLDLANLFGAGDEFFSQVFSRPVPRKRAIPMTVEEFELIAALEEAVLNMNLLTATRQFDDIRSENPLEFVGGLAAESEITFNSGSTSKYLAPVPFGLTIEEISARYLGDPDRYNEIITLNNLRSPYIDENGFFYQLLSNGDGRQFNIGSKDNLYVDQKIQISSNTVPMFVRKITAIEKITDDNYLITVDGLADLDLLTTFDNAKIKAFLPGTVNSQNQILIPSDQPIEEEPRTYDIPFLNGDSLTGLSKVDWLIDDRGDVVLNSFGEVALANGLTNIVQAMKMKISTQKGKILSEPNFGLGITPGVSSGDITFDTIVNDINDMVLQDSRFEAVDKVEITMLPPELSITISARLANGKGIFPINFTVPM